MADSSAPLPNGWSWWSVDLRTSKVRLGQGFDGLVERTITLEELKQRVHPDDRVRVEQEFRIATAGPTLTPLLLQFRFLGLDGRIRRFANAAGATAGPDGHPLTLDGIAADLETVRGDGTRLFRMQRLYNVLLAINHAMVDVSNNEALLARASRILVEQGGYPFASAAVVDHWRATRLSSSGTSTHTLDADASATDSVVLSWLPSAPQVWVSNDLETAGLGLVADALCAAGYRSAATLPLMHEGRVVAALMIRCHERHAFGTDELELLRQLAADLGFARAKLAQAQRFRVLFEEASDAMLVIDSTHSLLDVNQAAVRLLGYSREELRELTMRSLTPGDDPFQMPASSKSHVRQRSLRRRDGSFVPVEVNKRWVEDGLLHIIIRDLSERKRLESQLVLADRLASLGTLASGVAHELNNPLSWIISNLSQAKEQLQTLPDSPLRNELTELMAESLDGAHRIVSVVSDLKTYSRPEAPIARVSLHRVIEHSVQVLGIQARYRGALLKQLGPVPDVIGTEAQLSQVFINLLLNAVQSLPQGRPDENQVVIACFTGANGEAVVEVRDTGQGIEPETLNRIFDPFFTTKAPGFGTGLGLSLIYNIITGLGGTIEVQSTVAVGSTFRVVLPAAKPVELAKTSE